MTNQQRHLHVWRHGFNAHGRRALGSAYDIVVGLVFVAGLGAVISAGLQRSGFSNPFPIPSSANPKPAIYSTDIQITRPVDESSQPQSSTTTTRSISDQSLATSAVSTASDHSAVNIRLTDQTEIENANRDTLTAIDIGQSETIDASTLVIPDASVEVLGVIQAPETSSSIEVIDVDVQRPAKPIAKESRPALAVIPFEVKGDIPDSERDAGQILADLFLSEVSTNRYDLYERTQLNALMAEQALREADLINDSSAAVAFGRLVGIRYLTIGTIGRLAGRYFVTARIVDTQSGRIVKTADIEIEHLSDAGKQLHELAQLLNLASPKTPAPTTYAATSPTLISTSPTPILSNNAVTSVNTATTTNHHPIPTPTSSPTQAVIPTTQPSPVPPIVVEHDKFNVTLSTGQGKAHYVEGENISFVVETDQPCYITLITQDSKGDVTLLLPNAWHRHTRFNANERVHIPQEGSGFRFPIIPPHGRTIVKAIATPEPLSLSGVNQRRIREEKFVYLGNVRDVRSRTSERGITPTRVSPRHNEWDFKDLLYSTNWSQAELHITTSAN